MSELSHKADVFLAFMEVRCCGTQHLRMRLKRGQTSWEIQIYTIRYKAAAIPLLLHRDFQFVNVRLYVTQAEMADRLFRQNMGFDERLRFSSGLLCHVVNWLCAVSEESTASILWVDVRLADADGLCTDRR